MIRRKQTDKEQTKLEKRVASLPSEDLTHWVDQALFSIGRNISDWGKTSDYEYIDEAHLGSAVLLAVLTELKNRAEGSRNL
jgi:hypothetical protein